MTGVIESECRNIMESIAHILADQKENISDLPEGDQLIIRLMGSALVSMLGVANHDDQEYLKEVADAFQDSFTVHKDLWVDALAMNQTKMMGILSAGVI